MESRKPADIDKVQAFYNQISTFVESPDGMEAQVVINDWNSQLYGDVTKEAEVIMLMEGQGVSDRFLYGFYACFIAIRHENGGELPELSDERYKSIHDEQDRLQAVSNEEALAYFTKLEDDFYERFPITATLIAHLELDLRTRLHVPESDIEEGYVLGWYRALKSVMPVLQPPQ